MEAGNRCFDQRVPEEINRKIVDHIADINLPYSAIAREYLLREGLPPDRVIKTGSPMYEVLHHYLPKIERSDVLDAARTCRAGSTSSSAAHREENIDSPEQFAKLCEVLDAWPQSYGLPVIVSTHPRTRKRIDAAGVRLDPLVRLAEAAGFLRLCAPADAREGDSERQRHDHRGVVDPQLSRRSTSARRHERPEGMEEGAVMMTGLRWERIEEALDDSRTRRGAAGSRTLADRAGLRRAERLGESRADHPQLHGLREPHGLAKTMRILILSQFFQPEPHFKGLPFARELSRRGHEVEVLTGFPNYPGGCVYPGYRVRPWQREVLDGITVNRVPLYPSHDRSAVRRLANYASFSASAAVLGPLLVRRPDVVYVYHPPITLGLPAVLLSGLWRCPFVYDVQDLWPDTVATCGMMNRPRLLGMLDRWCRFIYRRADRLVVLSPGFKRVLVERGVDAASIDVIYNWTDEANIHSSARLCGDSPNFRANENGTVPFSAAAGRFNVVFAGTMGIAQGLDTVLDAARICAATVPDVRFVFVGGGVERARLAHRAEEMRLPNTLFLPRQPIETVGTILSAADVLLVHLKDDPLFRITIPCKTQAYLAAGRPILMAVPGDAAQLIERSKAGIACPSENPTALAATVQRLRTMDRPECEAIGRRGTAFYDRHLSLRVGAGRFEVVFQAAIDGRVAGNRGRRCVPDTPCPGPKQEGRRAA